MRLLPVAVVALLASACTIPDADVEVRRTLDSGFWDWETPAGLDDVWVTQSGGLGIYRSEAKALRALEPLALQGPLSTVAWEEESVLLGLHWISSHGDEWLELTGAHVRDSAVQAEGINHRQLDENGDWASSDASAVLYTVVVTSALPTNAGGTLSVEVVHEPPSD